MAFPRSTNPAGDSKAIIGALLENDDELRDLARQFVIHGMREVLNQLARGDATTRGAIARSLSGVITKAITETGEDDGNQSMRAEFRQMMEEMRGEIMAHDEDATPSPPSPHKMVRKK